MMNLDFELPKRYLINKELNVNGFSRSYLAYDKVIKKDVLIKFIPHDSIFYKILYNDFMLLFQFKHPNFVQVYDFGIIREKGLYYIMPYYEKSDLSILIEKDKIVFFLEVFFQLLCGLHYLHQRKRVHGNLNPNNIIISIENKKIRVRISEFFVASFIPPKEIIEKTNFKEYIAPELLSDYKAVFSPYTDFYSLGVYLFKMIFKDLSIDEYSIIYEENLTNTDKIKPAINIDEGIIKIILKMVNKNPDFRYKNSQQILKDLMPYLIKYSIKEKKESLMWKNVLKEIRKNKQIELKFYGEKIIKDIINKISKDFDDSKRINLSLISANNSLDIKLITDYIYYTYKHSNIPVVKIEKLPKANVKKYIFSLLEMNLPAFSNMSYKVLLFENCSDFVKYQDIFFNILKQNTDIKIIVGIDKNECRIKKAINGVKIIYHNVKKLSVSEVKEYLYMYFGYGVLPQIMEKHLLEQCNRDLKVLNQYIDYYIEKDIILYRNLKWYFRMELFDKNEVPKQIENELSDKLKKFDKDILSLLSVIVFWKTNFKIKELAQILHVSILKVDTRINLLKKYQLILQGKKFYSLYFPFLKISLRSLLPEDERKKSLLLISNFLEDKNSLDIEEEKILFDIYNSLGQRNKQLNIAKSILEKKDNGDFSENILENIFRIKEKFGDYDQENLFYLMLKYYWYLIDNDKIEKANEIYDYLNDKTEKPRNNKLANSFKIIYAHQLFLAKQYQKVISFLKNINFKELKPIEQINVLKISASCYNKLSDYRKEKESLLKIIRLSRRVKEGEISRIKINATISLAYLEERNGNMEKAYDILNNINLKPKKNPFLSIYVRSYLAKINIRMKKMSLAEKNLNLAEHILQKTGDKGDTRLYWETKSIYLFLTGNYWLSLVSNNNAFIQYKKKGVFNFQLYFFKIIILIRIGFISQAMELIKKGLKIASEEGQKGNLIVLKSYVEFLTSGVFKEKMDIIKIIQSNFVLPYDYYLQHFNYLKKNDDSHRIGKIEKFLKREEGKKRKNNLLSIIGLIFHFSVGDINKALTILNGLYKAISPLNEYSEYLNFLAYKINKEAFKQNLTIEDYKKYLKKARSIIQRKTELMPNDNFKTTYLKQNLITSIIYYYKLDVVGSVRMPYNADFLDTIEEMTKLISRLTDRKKLFNNILKLALKVSKTERGIIYAYSEKDNIIEEEYSYQFTKESINNIREPIEKLLKKVIKLKESIIQVQPDEFADAEIKTIIALPLMIHNNVIGLVYLDSKNSLGFSPEEIKFLNIFAHLAASALETSEIYTDLMQEKKQLNLLIKTPTKYIELGLIGNSKAMNDVYKNIEKISTTNVNVLIQGESGTGKELVAKAIYQMSLLKDKPFIPVDCGSLSDDIIESELFGHKKGSFTGAFYDKKGLFEEADGGTIFLDEISNISLSMQAKLLRVIQEGEIKRIGENKIRKVNVRIIAASNIDLKELVKEGRFREDLYFRLSTFPIFIPPLRERKEDLEILTIYFINYYRKLHNKNISGLTDEAFKILLDYDWPGNIRELKNELERAVILFNGNRKKIDKSYFEHLKKDNMFESDEGDYKGDFNTMINSYKLKLIENAYLKSGKNWTKTAKMLGISRQNLNQIYKRLKGKNKID